MGVYKKNNCWWIDYYVNDVRIRKPVSKTKSEAQKVLIKIKSDIIHKKYTLPNDEKIKFSDFSMKYIEEYSIPNKRSYKTDISKLKNLMTYFGDLYINEITDYHFQQYRNIRRKQKAIKRKNLISPTTINREGALLRSILNIAVKWGFLSSNPIKKIEMAKEEPKERILTEKEIQLLVSQSPIPLKHIILVALNTGMRLREILDMKWNQVNLENEFISIEAKTAKSRKIRRIPLNFSMQKLFSTIKLKSIGSIFVFENPLSKKPYVNIKTSWKSTLKRARINDFRFHDLRHCFATYTLLNGGDLISLKETLGHSDITTTSRYTKALMEGQRKLVNSFEVSDNYGEIIELNKKTGTK